MRYINDDNDEANNMNICKTDKKIYLAGHYDNFMIISNANRTISNAGKWQAIGISSANQRREVYTMYCENVN
jgi:hypothetical protein